jgi:hypothetical protein
MTFATKLTISDKILGPKVQKIYEFPLRSFVNLVLSELIVWMS